MADPIVIPPNGLSSWVLESSLPYYDRNTGSYTEEVWAGLYSTVDAQMDILKGRGAVSISPSKGGAVCKLTATFGGKATEEGGGGGGAGNRLSESWQMDPEPYENDLRTLPTWGPGKDLGRVVNLERARKLNVVDMHLKDGTFRSDIDAEGWDKAVNYGILASFGIKGYLRAPRCLVRTTTYAKGEDAEAAINYADDWTVCSWGAIGAPSWIKEPPYADFNASGVWDPAGHLQWLRFPAAWGAERRVFAIREMWKGAVLWSGALYKNGGAITE
jgi:hypothetical protein